MEKILSIEHLRKNYQSKNSETVAIEDFSFDLNSGEFVAIVGPSGCGKTTILSILAGLLNKTDGNIVMQENLKIGYMLQQDALFNHLTIYKNAILGLKLQHKLDKKHLDYVDYLFEFYKINDFKNKYPKSLSGGMKQRVG